MARDLRRAKSMTVPPSYRQAAEDDPLLCPPASPTAASGCAAEQHCTPWAGRVGTSQKQPAAGKAPMLSNRTQLQVPFAASRTLSRSNSGPMRADRPLAQPKWSKLTTSPRGAAEASVLAPLEGRKLVHTVELPPVEPPGARKPGENLRRTWSKSSLDEADPSTGAPSPDKSSQISESSSQSLMSPTSSTGLGEHYRQGHERGAGLTLEVQAAPGGPLIRHCRSSTTFMELGAPASGGGCQELSKELVSRPLSCRKPWAQPSSPCKRAAATRETSPWAMPSSGRRPASKAQALAPGGREADAACEPQLQQLAPDGNLDGREAAAGEASPLPRPISGRRLSAQPLALGGKDGKEAAAGEASPLPSRISGRWSSAQPPAPGGKEATAGEASLAARPPSGRRLSAQPLALGGKDVAAGETSPLARPISGRRLSAQPLQPLGQDVAVGEASPGARPPSGRRLSAQPLALGGKETADSEVSPLSGAGFTIAPIIVQLDSRLAGGGLSPTPLAGLEASGSSPSSPFAQERQPPTARESSPSPTGRQRSKSKLMVPGHLAIDRLELSVVGTPCLKDQADETASDAEDPQGGGKPMVKVPSNGSTQGKPMIKVPSNGSVNGSSGRRSPTNQLQLPGSLAQNLASAASTPCSSARGKGLWRQGLSGRLSGRRGSPRPPPPPEEPQKEIRFLRGEKIFDLYSWKDVLQEEGDGGKVVVCRVKTAPEETFPYVMKMRSKESLRKQRHEEEFRKSLTRMLNFPPHKGIIAPIEAMEDEKFYYTVMDRAMGGSFFGSLLKDFEDGKMPQTVVKGIMREILEAVGHIHKNRLLHRDIKPDNLVMQLSADPESPDHEVKRIKLIDFDHADSEWKPGTKSLDHSCYGSLRFNAPETLLGEYSASSDLYSVGGILYLLMTGKMPHSDSLFEDVENEDEDRADGGFKSEAWLKRMYQTLKEQVIDWACDPWPELPECRRFCASLLAFDPEERFSSADEALSAAWLTC